MDEREKIIAVIEKWADKAVVTKIHGASVYDTNNAAELADALIASNIGDVTAWKERAEKAEKERDKEFSVKIDSEWCAVVKSRDIDELVKEVCGE